MSAARRLVALLASAGLGLGAPAARADGPAPAPAATPESPAAPAPTGRHASLYRLHTAVLPPDGVLMLGFGADLFSIDYPAPAGVPQNAKLRDWRARLEFGPWPGLRATIDGVYRRWRAPAGLLPDGGGGLGDVQVAGQCALPSPTPAVAWAATVGMSLPTGSATAGTGEGRAVPRAGATATLRFWRASAYPELRIHLSAGRRWNPDAGRGTGGELDGGARCAPWPPVYPAVPAGGGAADNDFLQLGGAVELRRDDVSLFLEYSEARLPRASGVAVGEFPRALTPGLHWGRDDGWGLSLAYDVSLSLDDPNTPFVPGAPDLLWHAMLTRGVALGGRDRDGDGVADRRDACPTVAEDRDGWRDDDGCPELDNDGDGVPDAADGAPDRPEDRDGFADDDGIPDPDNDGDGIPDARDVCPDLAEDFDGDADGDGCPEERRDGDGDGISDERDHCPTAAEDRDGFEDDDGCPDPDNDLDGIDDARDRCPDAAEDYDGVADDDGCPD